MPSFAQSIMQHNDRGEPIKCKLSRRGLKKLAKIVISWHVCFIIVHETVSHACCAGLFGRFLRQLRVTTECSSFSRLSRFCERVKTFVADYKEQNNSTVSREQTRSCSATVSNEQIRMALQSQVHTLAQVTFWVFRSRTCVVLVLLVRVCYLGFWLMSGSFICTQRIGFDDPVEVEQDIKLILHESEPKHGDDESVGGHRVMSRRIPEAHFLRYMNALAGNDFTTALEELRRYFDFGACKGGDANAGLVGIPTQVGDSLHAHYAILNLAVLHLHFGMAVRFCFANTISCNCLFCFSFFAFLPQNCSVELSLFAQLSRMHTRHN